MGGGDGYGGVSVLVKDERVGRGEGVRVERCQSTRVFVQYQSDSESVE